jgi:glycosyltransferase involved in cell wall biosynthesis
VVGISLLTLVPGISGGSETYVRGLTSGLARSGRGHYRVFAPTIAADGWPLPTTVIDSYAASRTMFGRIRAMSKALVWPGPIKGELELSKLRVMHFPLTVTLPGIDHPPIVTTIHDVQHEYQPQFFSRAELAYRRYLYPRAVRTSARIITVSHHAKTAIVERLGAEPDNVRVIHHGVDTEELRPGSAAREPFILYPANSWPHKNHQRLFDAFQLVREREPGLRLILTGHGHDNRPLPPGAEALGLVPRPRLVELYQQASMLVFPSLYEGFGQPVIEAMACGCPVACSNATALPEVCGDAARLFDPTSVEAIADAILDVISHPTDLVARGLERARSFTWARNVREHDDVYEELAG